ncbi:MAG: RDD family protein [Bacillota bacterium]|nr:RDD family protein [Bacillota bacterium]
MFCSKCGQQNDDESIYCVKCGERLPHNAGYHRNQGGQQAQYQQQSQYEQWGQAHNTNQQQYNQMYYQQQYRGTIYAGFWRRFAARLIDQLLLGIISYVFTVIIVIAVGVSFAGLEGEADRTKVAAFIGVIAVYCILCIVGVWLYYALMESSSKQATLGKMAVGIIVTDLQGNRLTFARATGRYFAQILSGIILDIGFIMAAFTEKKQALHDMIADTLVVIK